MVTVRIARINYELWVLDPSVKHKTGCWKDVDEFLEEACVDL